MGHRGSNCKVQGDRRSRYLQKCHNIKCFKFNKYLNNCWGELHCIYNLTCFSFHWKISTSPSKIWEQISGKRINTLKYNSYHMHASHIPASATVDLAFFSLSTFCLLSSLLSPNWGLKSHKHSMIWAIVFFSSVFHISCKGVVISCYLSTPWSLNHNNWCIKADYFIVTWMNIGTDDWQYVVSWRIGDLFFVSCILTNYHFTFKTPVNFKAGRKSSLWIAEWLSKIVSACGIV